MKTRLLAAWALCALFALTAASSSAAAPGTSPGELAQALSYPFQDQLVSAPFADRIAWVQDIAGLRNVWTAQGPEFTPHQLTHYTRDDGQELTQLTFSPDASRLVFVRGGDHDANWPAAGGVQPDPDSSIEEPKVEIWSVDLKDGRLTRVAEGDAPAISSTGRLAYVSADKVFTAPLDGSGKAERLFFDRGKDGQLAWSPDGSRLAFVSDRTDHSFVGIYAGKDQPLVWIDPSTGRDTSPKWSPDGRQIAYVRQPGQGGAPEPHDIAHADPFSLRVADAASGEGRQVWAGPVTPQGSIPEIGAGLNLDWAAGGRLIFTAELDGWNHLYAVRASGGAPVLLTPGPFMIEHVALTRDRRQVVYDANSGPESADAERRHLFRAPVDRAAPVELTRGATLEWSPVIAGDQTIAAITGGVSATPSILLVGMDGARRDIGPRSEYAARGFVTPRPVTWTAPDGQRVHGVLFRKEGAGSPQPGVIFVHGGPPRQMLLGWHYMDYYSNAYAVNQYLATHGFVVLAVNYRLGIGYGRAYQHPLHAGPAGSSEYQDVLSGAQWLQRQPGVDASHIGIWGGSYGGLLTALALARNSDVFKAGVDLHGVHDWSIYTAQEMADRVARSEKGDMETAERISFAASPIADVARWRSPVLLIQGDDDRNVEFHQTVDLARRLDAQHVEYEELVLPNEIHGFLRYASWLKADGATVDFLTRKLAPR